MFDPSNLPPSGKEYILPPRRTFSVRAIGADGMWGMLTVESHTLETTYAGGVNFIDIVIHEETPVQRLRKAFAAGQWATCEEINYEPITTGKLIH